MTKRTNEQRHRKRKETKLKQARLEIVAGMYKRGYSLRKIQSEVVKRLELSSYSLATVHKDVQTLLDEWRENRIEDMDAALTLELERIDETCRELWNSGKSQRLITTRHNASRKALPPVTTRRGRLQSGHIRQKGRNRGYHARRPVMISAEIRKQLEERRKLLGLYAPEKKDINGNVSFASLLD